MDKEPTLSLEELGEVKTVRVYNQAYVDKQQKRIEALERSCGITQELLDKQIEATYILEKENAELKAKYDTRLRENTGLKIHNAYVEKKLTEAKEIIRKFVEWANWQGNSKCPSFKIIQDKAAQFLEGSK